MADVNNTEREATSVKAAVKSEKGSVSPKVAVGGAIAAGILAAGIGASALGGAFRGEQPQPVGTETPSAAAASSTPKETTMPSFTIEPTASPTEKPKTPQELIDIARKAHLDALARGEFRLPEPDSVLSEGGRIDQGGLTENGERDLFIVITAGKDISIPSLIDGTVIEARKANSIINLITIQEGTRNINIIFPVAGNMKVEKGDKVTIGKEIFSIRYDPESANQKTFENTGTDKKPQGTIAVIALQDSTAGPGSGFQELSLTKGILFDQSGNPLKIPTMIQ